MPHKRSNKKAKERIDRGVEKRLKSIESVVVDSPTSVVEDDDERDGAAASSSR